MIEKLLFLNPEDTFFPVKLCRLYWEDDDFFNNIESKILCKNFFAVVDMEHKHVFSTVTKDYVLYTHRRTFDFGIKIAQTIFEENKFMDIAFRGMNVSDYGAAVEYEFCRKISINQPEIVDGWIPIIIMGNSYNKTKTLECCIGFANTKYHTNLLLPDYMIKVKSAHTTSVAAMEINIMSQIDIKGVVINKLIHDFNKVIENLKDLPISFGDMLPLFCKIQGITKKQKIADFELTYIRRVLTFVNEKIKIYTSEYGNNAYALLMVMADYIENINGESKKIRSKSYLGLGKWVDEYISVTSNPNYSPYQYIGKEAYDTASWFGMLK